MDLSKETSPGNVYKINQDTPDMRLPSLKFIWRLECEIAKEEVNVGAPHNAGVIRSIANIVSGSVKGPGIEGEVLHLGGADWATVIAGTHSMKLDARYTVKTSDGAYLYIRAKGLYRPGPGTDYAKSDLSKPPPEKVTQDDVEFFSHLKLETGSGKYNWLNGLVCVGVMECVGTRIVIDAYYLTNFPDMEAESVMAKIS